MSSLPLYVPVLKRTTLFCDQSPLVLQGERFYESLVFDAQDAAWGVAWRPGVAAGSGAAAELDPVVDADGVWFQRPSFRVPLRRFLVRARQHTRRFGFCGYWYLHGQSLVGWWRAYLETPDEAARTALGLPFGVLDPTEAAFEAAPLPGPAGSAGRRALRVAYVVGAGATPPSGIAWGVFDYDTTLLPGPRTYLRASLTATRQLLGRNGGSGTLLDEATTPEQLDRAVVPRSVFYDLEERWAALDEVRANHLDVEGCVSQPLVALNVQPLDMAHTSIDRVSPVEMFDEGTIQDALLDQAAAPQMYTREAAARLLDEERRQLRALLGRDAAGRAPDATPSEEKRRYFRRPHLWDNPVELLGGMRPGLVHVPRTVVDLVAMEQRYVEAAAAALNVPLDVLQRGRMATPDLATQTDQRLLGGTRAVANVYDRRLQQAVATERVVYQALFDQVYQRVFAPLDVDAMDALIVDLDKATDRLLHQEEGAVTSETVRTRAGRHALAAQLSGATDAARLTLAQTRELLETRRQQARTQGGLATLVFRTSMTQEHASKLAGLLELYDKGLVEARQLEPLAREVFGQDLRLREPPAPVAPLPPPAATDARGGPPGRGRKRLRE